MKVTLPGPGDYKDVDNICGDGHYTVSRNKGSGKRLFTGQKRNSFIDDAVSKSRSNKCIFSINKHAVPGPGNYRQLS